MVTLFIYVANDFSSFAKVLGQVITPGNNFYVVIMYHETLLLIKMLCLTTS